MLIQPKTTKAPRSTATNAYDLFSDVIQAIREEPLRFDMSSYKRTKHEVKAMLKPPVCNTVMCFAGWTAMLKAKSDNSVTNQNAEGRALKLFGIMRPVLGGSTDYENPLFDRFDELDSLFGSTIWHNDPGTRKYAAEVLKGFRAFQKKYAADLKAHKLEARPWVSRP